MSVDSWMPYALKLSFDDRGLDARSQWIGKGKHQRCMLSATKQAISIKLATTVGPFLRGLDLDFANGYKACPACCFCCFAEIKQQRNT